MPGKVLCITALIALLFLPSQATAVGPQTVLTFDDINTGGVAVPIRSGYGGFNWATSKGIWGLSNPPYLPQSPPNRVLFNLHNREPGNLENVETFICGVTNFHEGTYPS